MTPRRERILFVELWRLGDAVAATAGLRALRLARPDAEIAVLAHSRHGDPLFRSPYADRHLRFDAFWTRGQLARHKYLPWTIDYRSLYRAARQVRAFRPDQVILFRGDAREQLFFRMLGDHEIIDLQGALPMLPGIRRNVRPAGVPRWREYVYQIRESMKTPVHAEPSIAGVRREPAATPYVLVHPGASWRYKQWSVKNVASLIRWLDVQGHAVKVVAGAADRSFVDALCAEYASALDVEYPTLHALYTLIAGARVVVCNNSAALHIAEALGTPCVATTGSSDPVRWGTYRDHSRTVCRSEHLACHPCGEKRCVLPDAPCIDRIAVADVLEALNEIGLAGSERHIPLRTASSHRG